MQSKPPPSQPHPTQNNNTKSQAKTTIATNTLLHQTNLLLRYSPSKSGSDAAWWRRCAAHDDDKVRIATNNQDITKLQNKCNQSPLPHNHIQLKTTTQNHKQKQQSQQTPCSIKQTYC
jgi:hypothetical protein